MADVVESFKSKFVIRADTWPAGATVTCGEVEPGGKTFVPERVTMRLENAGTYEVGVNRPVRAAAVFPALVSLTLNDTGEPDTCHEQASSSAARNTQMSTRQRP